LPDNLGDAYAELPAADRETSMARHAPKPSQDPDDDHPAVVDLARYRKARQAQTEAKRSTAPPAHEPLLGGRKGAGLILAGCLAVAGALWILSLAG
jgi:hypothetical protein